MKVELITTVTEENTFRISGFPEATKMQAKTNEALAHKKQQELNKKRYWVEKALSEIQEQIETAAENYSRCIKYSGIVYLVDFHLKDSLLKNTIIPFLNSLGYSASYTKSQWRNTGTYYFEITVEW